MCESQTRVSTCSCPKPQESSLQNVFSTYICRDFFACFFLSSSAQYNIFVRGIQCQLNCTCESHHQPPRPETTHHTVKSFKSRLVLSSFRGAFMDDKGCLYIIPKKSKSTLWKMLVRFHDCQCFLWFGSIYIYISLHIFCFIIDDTTVCTNIPICVMAGYFCSWGLRACLVSLEILEPFGSTDHVFHLATFATFLGLFLRLPGSVEFLRGLIDD